MRVEGVATLSEVCQLAHFLCAIVSNVQKSQPIAIQVKYSTKNQVTFLEHFAGFLFDDDLVKILEQPDVSINQSQEAVDCLHQLKDVFLSFRTLADKYYEPYSKAVGHPESQTSVEEAYTDEEDA